ncbi:hypothetical protein [Burkholderia cepacia]|uniref:hypothetical protein n=1 Tax=Burkholderia cepacia TaxID=292 RepID=UPI0015925184|nr:hypothetical protein [Burkholderia cepacia]
MAAAEVATVAAQASVNWYGVVASSAVIGAVVSAVINSATTLWGQHRARKHENAKLAEQRAHEHAKLAEERARSLHVAMRLLEEFAQDADGVLNRIEAAFDDYGHVQDAVFKHLKAVDLRLELPAQSILDALPRPLVDQLCEFLRALVVSGDWLDKHEVRLDAFDNWKLEVQRVVHFGVLACDLALRRTRLVCFQSIELAVAVL